MSAATAKIVQINGEARAVHPSGKTGRPPGNQDARERTQRTRDVKPKETKKKLSDDFERKMLIPFEDLHEDHGLNDVGMRWYERERRQHLDWENGPGTRAFLKYEDTHLLVAAARFWQIAGGYRREISNIYPAFDANLLAKEGAALRDFKKAMLELGYIPGTYPQAIKEDYNEEEEDLFGA